MRQKWGFYAPFPFTRAFSLPIRGTSGISQLLGAAKLHSAPGADNPRYVAESSAAALNRHNELSTSTVILSALWTRKLHVFDSIMRVVRMDVRKKCSKEAKSICLFLALGKLRLLSFIHFIAHLIPW